MIAYSYDRNGYRTNQILSYAARPLSRCYLRSYLVKNTAGAHKVPSNKYKNNLRTLGPYSQKVVTP